MQSYPHHATARARDGALHPDGSRRRPEQHRRPATARLELATGTSLTIRALEPSDRDGVGQLFARLSAQSRYQRFLATKPDLTARELAFLTRIDHVHHDALAAVDERDQSIVGIVRYVQVADRPGVADVAAEVADELHNMGIATMLAELTIERARANGFTTLTATVFWDNQPARAILRRVGFRARGSAGATLELELQL